MIRFRFFWDSWKMVGMAREGAHFFMQAVNTLIPSLPGKDSPLKAISDNFNASAFNPM